MIAFHKLGLYGVSLHHRFVGMDCNHHCIF